MATLTRIGTFLKQHWQVVLVACAVAYGYAWYHRQASLNADAVARLNAAHSAEVAQVNQARVQEEQQHQQELQQLQSTLAQLQQQYDMAQAQLQQRQVQERATIVRQYSNDAPGLAQLLSSRFNFTVQVTQ